jgi:PAS domain S-box-containing protein
MTLPEPAAEPTLSVAFPAHAVDMVPLGIVRTDRDGRFTYANRPMLQLAGLPGWQGLAVADLFAGPERERVMTELASRFEQRAASEYTAELTHVDGRAVPVSITAFPEMDATGEVVGALALVRDLSVEHAQQRMYRLVQTETDSTSLLDAIARTLAPLLPFDRLQVISLNQDRTHLRTIYPCSGADAATPRQYRWWRVPESVGHLVRSQETLVIDDLPRWYAAPERRALLAEPAVQAFLAEGFVSMMSLPVCQGDQQVASIVLSRRGGHRFLPAERRLADELPLTEAVSVALRNEKEGTLSFLLDLMKHISSAYDSVNDVAQGIVDRIAQHYGWDEVSLFQVFPQRGDAGEIHMIAQWARHEALRRERRVYPMDAGVIGHVVREGRSVLVGDLENDPVFGGIFVPHSHTRTRSELCVPVGKGCRWLLNVEDKLADAFAPEERRDLEAIAAGLGALLERTLDHHYRMAIFGHANDAILLVDERGSVFEINDAGASLLRLPRAAIEGRPIADFLDDPEDARDLLRGESFLNDELVMRRAAPTQGATALDERVKVLMSVAPLPPELGGKIFIASDMTQVERVAQLELGQAAYREITRQVKTPMSLAISWLRRHAERSALPAQDIARRAVAQLERAELTLDRIMLAEPGLGDEAHREMPLSVAELLACVRDELPVHEREVVRVDGGDTPAWLRGDAFELRYCLQTVLTYLLRLAAESDVIAVRVARGAADVAIVLSGRGERRPGARSTSGQDDDGDVAMAASAGQVRMEMALGLGTLERLVARNHGRFAMRAALDDATAGAPASEAPAESTLAFHFSFPTIVPESAP